MRQCFHRRAVLKALFTSVASTIILSKSRALAQGDPLPSWRDGKAKQSILDFVATVTREGSPGFVPVSQRVATFDNDGTLWCEQPMYVQVAFALDQVKARASEHPEWKKKQPFKAVLDGDMCAECHSTGLRKNYDAERDRYATTWSEISVGCEACHAARRQNRIVQIR